MPFDSPEQRRGFFGTHGAGEAKPVKVPLAHVPASTPAAQGGPKELSALLEAGPDFPHRVKVLARLEKASISHLGDRATLEHLGEQVDGLEELRPLLAPATAGAALSVEQERALEAIDQAQTVIRLRQQGILDRRATEAAQDVSALLVEGETYPLRRELRALGGKWNPELGAWVVPADTQASVEALAGGKLKVEPIEVKGSALQELDRDTLRERRQGKKDARVEALLDRADRLEREAQGIRADHERSGYTDWQFITQPILVGHHSEGRMRRLRDRISRQMDTEIGNRIEAGKLREQAARLERDGGARVRGDARREAQTQPRTERRDLNPELRPGAIIEAPKEFWTGRMDRFPAGTPLEVVRVSPKSVTLRPVGLSGTFDQGKLGLSEVAQAKLLKAAPAKFRLERAPLNSRVVPGARVKVEYMAINRGGVVEKITPTKVLVRLDGDNYAYPVPREFSTITPEGGEA